MFKLYKNFDTGNAPYYSTTPSDIYESIELDEWEYSEFDVNNEALFNRAMHIYAEYCEDGVGYDDHQSFDLKPLTVLECDSYDEDDIFTGKRYSVVEHFYSPLDCNVGITFKLPYKLYFIDVGV
jgi:hypothetical protein